VSGHSKWSTIKRQKQANDSAKGKVFSKLSRGISLAVKTGGGSNPDTNYKLRIALDLAKAQNMPKGTIDRAISKASESGDLEEVTYEGFGPSGVQVMIEAATDNRNRTAQNLKSLLDKYGGSMGGPGAVSFNFKPKGLIVLKNEGDEEQMLKVIDHGVEDIEESEESLEIYVPVSDLYQTAEKLETSGFKVLAKELVQKPLSLSKLKTEKDSEKIINLLNSLEEHEDVQNVFTNAEIS